MIVCRCSRMNWQTVMKSRSPSQGSKTLCHILPIWIRWCSIATLITAVGLFGVSVLTRNYQNLIATSLVPSLVVASCFAIFLNIYSVWHIRREHREVDRAFRNTDSEFLSIFQNVLDGILIVDNEGNCMDANPAAASILRLPTNKLIGQGIRRFLSNRDSLDERWNSFLQNKSQRGRAQLVAGDGTTLFVDFT